MLTTLKSIIRRIDMYDAKIIYDKYEPFSNKNSLLFFSALEGSERTEFEHLSDEEKKTYISNSSAIHIPLVSIDEFFSDYKRVDPITVEFTLDVVFSLFPQIKDAYDKHADAFALFCILHELGHWNHFLNCSKNVYSYIGDTTEAKRIFDEKQILQSKFQQAQSQAIMDSLRKQAQLWVRRYHDIPGEKMADDFARNHFPGIWIALQKDL